MKKRIRSAYLDTDVLSIYATGVRAGQRFHDFMEMIGLVGDQRIKLMTSSVLVEESDGGRTQAPHRERIHALRRLHVIVRTEPRANIVLASELAGRSPAPRERKRLLNDARHLLMAHRMGCDVLVTDNTKDFVDLLALAGAPKILISNPSLLASMLAEGRYGRRSNPPRPIRRGSLRAYVLKRLREIDRRTRGGRRGR